MVAIGTPRPSVSTWRLLPSLPRSVGLGPTAAAGVRVLGGSGAFTRQPSAACQAHWMPCSCPYRCKHACHRRCNAPVATHRWKRSCTVVAGPNSRGRARHWQPVRNTYSTPSKTRRVSIHGRPPLGCSAGRKIGSAIVHNSSGTRQIVGSTSDATSRLFKFYLRHSLPEWQRVIGQILISSSAFIHSGYLTDVSHAILLSLQSADLPRGVVGASAHAKNAGHAVLPMP